MSRKESQRKRPRYAVIRDTGIVLECKRDLAIDILVRVDTLGEHWDEERAKQGWKFTSVGLNDLSLDELAKFIAALTDRYNSYVEEYNKAAHGVPLMKLLDKVPSANAAA